jgi:hypothetical protein
VEETRALPRAGEVRTARDVESRAQQGNNFRSEGIGQRPVGVNGHPRAGHSIEVERRSNSKRCGSRNVTS